jgi:hypothetical protein
VLYNPCSLYNIAYTDDSTGSDLRPESASVDRNSHSLDPYRESSSIRPIKTLTALGPEMVTLTKHEGYIKLIPMNSMRGHKQYGEIYFRN